MLGDANINKNVGSICLFRQCYNEQIKDYYYCYGVSVVDVSLCITFRS